MKNDYLAFVLKDVKTALLYFDNVVPLDWNEMELFYKEKNYSDGIRELKLVLPEFLKLNSEYNILNGFSEHKMYGINEEYYDFLTKKRYWGLGIVFNENEKVNVNKSFMNFATEYTSEMLGFLEKYKNKGIIFGGDFIEKEDENTQMNPCIVLGNINMIDTTNAKIEQIIEIRNDKESMMKLARLRKFVSEEIAKKTANQIEDELYVAMQNYDIAAKKHGFELQKYTLNTILTKENLLMILGASIINGIDIVKIPYKEIIEALVPLSIFAKDFYLEFKGKKLKDKELMETQPVSYIIEVEKKLKTPAHNSR